MTGIKPSDKMDLDTYNRRGLEGKNNNKQQYWRNYMATTSITKEFEDRIKEALTNTGTEHQEMNGSLSDGGASLCHSNI